MTEKAQRILNELALRTGMLARKKEPMDEDALARMNDEKIRDQVLEDFNTSTLDPVGAVPGASGDRFLKELNEIQDLERNAGRKENPDR